MASILFTGIEPGLSDAKPVEKKVLSKPGGGNKPGLEKVAEKKTASKKTIKIIGSTDLQMRKREIECPQTQKKIIRKCIEILTEYQ